MPTSMAEIPAVCSRWAMPPPGGRTPVAELDTDKSVTTTLDAITTPTTTHSTTRRGRALDVSPAGVPPGGVLMTLMSRRTAAVAAAVSATMLDAVCSMWTVPSLPATSAAAHRALADGAQAIGKTTSAMVPRPNTASASSVAVRRRSDRPPLPRRRRHPSTTKPPATRSVLRNSSEVGWSEAASSER